MYDNEDELYNDPLFNRRSSSKRISKASGGRLTLTRNVRENRTVLNDRNKSSNLSSQTESPKKSTQILQSHSVKNKESISVARNNSEKKKQTAKTNNVGKVRSPSHGDDTKYTLPEQKTVSKTITKSITGEPLLQNLKINYSSPVKNLLLASVISGRNSLPEAIEEPKQKCISHKDVNTNKLNSNPQNATTPKSGMPSMKIHSGNKQGTKTKMLFSENTSSTAHSSHFHSFQSDSKSLNAKRLCLSNSVVNPGESTSRNFSKESDQKVSLTEHVNRSPVAIHEYTESFDLPGPPECELDISDDIFLSLESYENKCEISSNTPGAKLTDEEILETVLPPCIVNTKLNDVGKQDNTAMPNKEVVWNDLSPEKSSPLPSCATSKLQVQQPITTFFTGVSNETVNTSVALQKSDNKKAWEGMMALMRSNATSKKPVKAFTEPVKVGNPWQQTKPNNKNHVNTATTASTSRWKSNSDRPCPFYKKIPGTGFAVDAFSYGTISGVTSYFLSHFHSDHYIGLKASFGMPIYCTSITASLVQLNIRVKSQFLHILPLNEAQEVDGVKVTALDANHCPGSAMLLFQLRNGSNILHVGDFRATSAMEHIRELSGLRISQLYLDTTYCDAKYDFPTQEDAVAKAVGLVLSHLHKNPRTVVVCGTYLIGKEKLFMGVAETLDCRIWALPPKAKILRLLQDPALTARLIDDPLAATVHVVSMNHLRLESLQQYQQQYSKQFTHVLALKPSGWEFSRGSAPVTRGNVTIAGVAYSEHSNFSELARFVKFIRPASIIPTVNVGSAQSRQAMQKHFATWLSSQG